jgi:hypothetical protein
MKPYLEGEQVIVQRRVVFGADAFNNITYETYDTPVDNVLIAPGPRADLTDSNRPDGHLVKYTLHFPKTYTASLEGCRVQVKGEWLSVIGSPGWYDPELTPGAWNRPVEVEVVHG